MMIRRRDSLGFIELMRGKYEIHDSTGIQTLIDQTTLQERVRLKTLPFTELWRQLWNGATARRYTSEFDHARSKFEQLRVTLPIYCAASKTTWEEPEWGFPKGRRCSTETERDCAFRETYEETGVSKGSLTLLDGAEPLTEEFAGSNGIRYRHRYWIAQAPADLEVGMDPANRDQSREISDVRWCSLEEGRALIRPYNTEKRRILEAAAVRIKESCSTV